MTHPCGTFRTTLAATPAMRAAVLDEAELAGLPPRVAAIGRILALTSTSAARAYIAGQRHQGQLVVLYF